MLYNTYFGTKPWQAGLKLPSSCDEIYRHLWSFHAELMWARLRDYGETEKVHEGWEAAVLCRQTTLDVTKYEKLPVQLVHRFFSLFFLSFLSFSPLVYEHWMRSAVWIGLKEMVSEWLASSLSGSVQVFRLCSCLAYPVLLFTWAFNDCSTYLVINGILISLDLILLVSI